jgi:SAM-dependent methyltransferase
VREGVAERLPLADAAVDAVTIGDAFHWFDHAPALAQIRRVLRPRCGLAILSTVPDWRGASWGHELGTLISSLRPEHPHFDGPPWQDAVRAADGWTPPREIRVTTSQPAQPERIVYHVRSMSWIAALPEAERAGVLTRIRALIEAGQTPAEMPTHVVIGLTALDGT